MDALLPPPDIGPVSFDASLDPQKLKEAADRALNFYLNPGATETQVPPANPAQSSPRRSGG